MSKTNRYPLLRIRIYPDRRSAVEAYRECKAALRGRSEFLFKDSDLFIEDRYLRIEYWPKIDFETRIRGRLPDKIDVVGWIPNEEEQDQLKSSLNPRTTVLVPFEVFNV